MGLRNRVFTQSAGCKASFRKKPVSLVGAPESEIYYVRFNLYEFTALKLLSGG